MREQNEKMKIEESAALKNRKFYENQRNRNRIVRNG